MAGFLILIMIYASMGFVIGGIVGAMLYARVPQERRSGVVWVVAALTGGVSGGVLFPVGWFVWQVVRAKLS